jgi:WD40 repeat protein
MEAILMRHLGLLAVAGLLLAGLPHGVRAELIPVPCWANFPVDPLCPRAIYSLAFSPDGQVVASGLEDGRVLLWNVCPPPGVQPPLTFRLALPGSWGPVYAVAFSPANDRLAAVSGETAVNVWKLTEQEVSTMPGYRGRVLSLAFSADGSLLATGGGVFVTCGEVRLWQIHSPPRPGETPPKDEGIVPYTDFVGHRQMVSSVAFSPDGKLLASAGGRFGCPGEVYLWDVATRTPLTMLPPFPDQALALTFSPDGTTLAVACRDGTISLWDVATRRLRCWWLAHSREIFFLAYACQGRTIVSASADATVKFWEPVHGWPVACLKDPCWQRSAGDLFSAALSPNGLLLATGSVCGRLQLWDLRPLLVLPPPVGSGE